MQTHRHRRFGVEWIMLTALHVVVAGAMTVALVREHHSVRQTEFDRLQGQARVIDENLSRQLVGADKALLGMARGLGQATAADSRSVVAQLRLLTDAMPGFSSMLWLDAHGTVIAAPRDDMIGKNFSTRDYFDAPRRSGDPDRLFVSPPFHTTVGAYVIVASRMVVDGEGRFAGVVTATLDPDYFGVLLKSVLYAPDMRAALVHQGGAVFLDVHDAAAGAGLAPGDVAALLAQPRRGADAPPELEGSAVLRIGGAARLVSLRALDRSDTRHDAPLVAVVSRDLSAVLAPWVTRTWQAGSLLAAFIVVSAGSLWLDQRRRREARRASAAADREHRAAADRVEQALHGADLGLWELHVPSDAFVTNARERSLLGYESEEELRRLPSWRSLIHPDDRARVAAAIVPHLKGETPAYDCEHRMLHRDGRYVWLFSRAMIVERGPEGAPIRIVGTHLDITERKSAQAELMQATSALRASEGQLRLLTDNMPALVSRLDLEQRFRFANRAYDDWLQVDPASLIGRTLREVYGDAAHDGFRHHIERALTGARVTYERHLPSASGHRRVEFTLVPEFDPQGAVSGLYTLATDITARHEAERRQARSEERLSIALEGSGQVLFDWNLATQTVYQSAQAAVIRGEPAAAGDSSVEVLHRTVHPDDLPGVIASARRAVTAVTPLFEADFRILHKAGDWIWVRMRGRVVEHDGQGRALRVTGIYSDISGHKLEEGRLRRLAEFDALTGLPNRALFRDRLNRAMARSARGKPMALLFLDIDHFKDINDTLGHEAGDEVLRVFALRMQSVVRASDTVARLGGDEFTIILEDLRTLEDASTIADKLNRTLEQPMTLDDGPLRVTASIGIAFCAAGEGDEAALLRRADGALYEAKRRGRNSHFCAEAGP